MSFVLTSSKNMISTKSDYSDVVSNATSTPRSSPKPLAYYVQSPSLDSHEEDKSCTSASATVIQTATPSDTLSLLSLFSRVSGSHGFRRKGRREKETGELLGLGDVDRIMEEEEEEGEKNVYVKWWKDEERVELSRNCKALLWVLFIGLVFFVACLIVWCFSKSFVAQVHLKNMKVNNIYYGEGSDIRGVPTKLLTVNCSLNITVHNTATFFGIHVSCSNIILRYYDVVVASGQLDAYYQPRKSWRNMNVKVAGRGIPLYGAGAGFELTNNGKGVPLVLEFMLWTQGHVVGKLVKTKHRRLVRCFLNITSDTQFAKFTGDSCA